MPFMLQAYSTKAKRLMPCDVIRSTPNGCIVIIVRSAVVLENAMMHASDFNMVTSAKKNPAENTSLHPFLNSKQSCKDDGSF